MRTTKTTWQNALYTGVLLAAVCLLFQWYSTANSRRIENQNMSYAMDSAGQTAQRIESEFNNALLRLRNYAYLLGANQSPPEITTALLRGMEENASFDAVRFTNAEGLNLASNGQTNDSSDREYYINGMQGESGVQVVRSRLTGQIMTVFYAPVKYDGEIIGMLLGLYFAEDYLRNMLSTSYFGEPADVFLCALDGQIIASSDEGEYDRPLPDMLRDSGQIDEKIAEDVWTAFRKGTGSAGFLCARDSLVDNLCVFHLPSKIGRAHV